MLEDELLEYAELMNDEFGEYCIALCELAMHHDFLYEATELQDAITKEMKVNLKYFKERYTIVKKMKTFEQRVTLLKEKDEKEKSD